jgi:long-subunit fatty acid transport protein
MTMKKHVLGITSAATLGAVCTLFARDASAAGTALDVQSARGTGMASANVAFIDDSTAIFYNPAGIAQGKVYSA